MFPQEEVETKHGAKTEGTLVIDSSGVDLNFYDLMMCQTSWFTAC